jgi:hypothetical protein
MKQALLLAESPLVIVPLLFELIPDHALLVTAAKARRSKRAEEIIDIRIDAALIVAALLRHLPAGIAAPRTS